MYTLVTGASGFIGSHLTDHLIASGEKIRVLVRPGRQPSAFLAKESEVDIAYGDLTDLASLKEATKNVSVVYHAAALLRAADSNVLQKTNVAGVKNLLEACVKNNINRLVFISSVAAYAPSQTRTLNENAPLGGMGAYGRSKAEAETLIKSCAESTELTCTIIRPCVVYGERDTRNFTPRLLSLLNRNIIPTLANAPDHLGMVHAADLVRATVLAGTSPRAINQAYNVTGGSKTSIQHIVEIYQEITGQQKLTLPLPLSLLHSGLFIRWVISNVQYKRFNRFIERYKNKEFLQNFFLQRHHYDIGKAQTELGYEPTIDLYEGLRRTINWYRH